MKTNEKRITPFHIPQEVLKNTPLSAFRQKYLLRNTFSLLVQRIKDKSQEFVKGKHLMVFLHSFQMSFQKIYYLGFHMIDISKPIRVSLKAICQNISVRFHEKTLIFCVFWHFI